nr:peptidyl-prolyl cis-trans isomerase [uncultured Fretibacterium sp.]
MKGFFSKKLALGLALVVLVGVALAWAAQTQTQPEQMQSEMKDAPKTDPERVLAKVSDREIREKDIDQVIRMMGPQGAMMYDNPQGRRAVLDELVSMHLFALRGAEEKLDQTPEFKAALETFRNQSLARAAIDASLKDVTASDEDAKKFYDEHPDQFTQPERVHVRHILISDDVTSADAIAKVQADLKAGVSFDEVAKSRSLCPSAAQGGDLGEVSKGQMVPEFEAAAFALKDPGDLSEPVKTQFGWHIIRLEGRTPSSLEPFDTVKPQLLQYLTNEKRNEAFKNVVEGLKKTYKVEMLVPEEPVSGDKASGDKK